MNWDTDELGQNHLTNAKPMRKLLTLPIAVIATLVATAGSTPAQLAPPFGGVPSGGSLGIGLRGDGVSGTLRLNLGQSSSRSISSTTAGVTTSDGFPGSIQSTVTRPFVTGFTPVIADYPIIPNAAATIADRDQYQLHQIRNSQQTLANRSLQKYLRRAIRAEEKRDKRVARANYRAAMRLAGPPLRVQIQARMQAMLEQTQ